MKLFITVVIFIIILLIAGLLGARNEQMVVFDYLLADLEIRLSLLLALFFATGLLLSALVFILVWLKMKWRITRLERKRGSAVSTTTEKL